MLSTKPSISFRDLNTSPQLYMLIYHRMGNATSMQLMLVPPVRAMLTYLTRMRMH